MILRSRPVLRMSASRSRRAHLTYLGGERAAPISAREDFAPTSATTERRPDAHGRNAHARCRAVPPCRSSSTEDPALPRRGRAVSIADTSRSRMRLPRRGHAPTSSRSGMWGSTVSSVAARGGTEMTRDAHGSCPDCFFYRHVSSTMWTGVGEARKVALGECRRRAPFGFLTITNGWPYVNDSGWCGEFKAENAVPNKPEGSGDDPRS